MSSRILFLSLVLSMTAGCLARTRDPVVPPKPPIAHRAPPPVRSQPPATPPVAAVIDAFIAAGRAHGATGAVLDDLALACDVLHAAAEYEAAEACASARYVSTHRAAAALQGARSALMVATTAHDPGQHRAACARAYDLLDRQARVGDRDRDEEEALVRKSVSYHAAAGRICGD